MNSLLRAKLGEQVSLVIRLLYLAVGIFPFFQRLLDEAGYEDKHLLHDISCLPLTGLAPVSGVLSTQICTRNRFSVRVLVEGSST